MRLLSRDLASNLGRRIHFISSPRLQLIKISSHLSHPHIRLSHSLRVGHDGARAATGVRVHRENFHVMLWRESLVGRRVSARYRISCGCKPEQVLLAAHESRAALGRCGLDTIAELGQLFGSRA